MADPEESPPSEEPRVPLSRAERMAENAAAKAREETEARLKAEFATRAETPKEPKTWTRAELAQLVDNGDINQAQADELMDRQHEFQVKRQIHETVTQGLTQQSRQTRIESQIDRYKELVPDVADESDTRRRVAAEYRYLVDDLGDPEGHATELKALRAVLGPLEKLQAPRRPAPAHEETNGEGGGESSPEGFPKDMPRKHRDYYQKMLDDGFYKDMDAVEAEWAKASPKVRANSS